MGRPKKIVNEVKLENPIDESNQDDFLRQLEETRKSLIPKMKIALVRRGAIFKQANQFAAGYDVKAFDMKIEDGYIKYMLGIKSELPVGWYAAVQHRSSNSKFDSILANLRGIIDCDFRGEWQARLKLIPQPIIHLSPENTNELVVQQKLGSQYIKLWQEGEISLQVTFHKIPDHEVVFVEESELSDTQRGEGGHGSTGNGLSQLQKDIKLAVEDGRITEEQGESYLNYKKPN